MRGGFTLMVLLIILYEPVLAQSSVAIVLLLQSGEIWRRWELDFPKIIFA